MSPEKTSHITNTFSPPHPLKTAVLFLIFNRPDTTKQVFETIRKAKPPRLYVAADGPRTEKSGEAEKCEQVRRIATQADWDCEVKTFFRKENIGCGKAVSKAITWFFENEEEGIIIEDDCLPSQSFFWFCEELLERYRGDMRVWHIAGNNFNAPLQQMLPNEFDRTNYIFSSFAQVWGWASWSCTWKHFDYSVKTWPFVSQNKILTKSFPNKFAYYQKANHIDLVYRGRIDTWDYQWQYTILSNHGLVVVPTRNLVSNIGHGDDSTHTTGFDKLRNNLPVYDVELPLKHPNHMIPSLRMDRFYADRMSMGLKDYMKKVVKWIIK